MLDPSGNLTREAPDLWSVDLCPPRDSMSKNLRAVLGGSALAMFLRFVDVLLDPK
jgi:hypothetical protein